MTQAMVDAMAYGAAAMFILGYGIGAIIKMMNSVSDRGNG